MARLCYSQRFEDVYKSLINVAEAYFLPFNRAPNIIALKAKVLSPNSRYKHVAYVLENYSQIRNKLNICVVIRKEVILNRLEDLVALNICA